MSDGWLLSAACRGMDVEIFYPARGDWVKSEAAKTICRRCDVQKDCLDDALADPYLGRFGIRGGLGPKERNRIRVESGATGRTVAS